MKPSTTMTSPHKDSMNKIFFKMLMEVFPFTLGFSDLNFIQDPAHKCVHIHFKKWLKSFLRIS